MTAYQQLAEIYEKISHLQHTKNVANWDEAVMMPVGGGASRGDALATLSKVIHEIATQPIIADLIDKARSENLDAWQRSNLHLIEKSYRSATCIPASLVQKISAATTKAEQAWRKLRAENNWKEFAPYLAENIALTKESAQIRADSLGKNIYDLMLDDFSPDVSQDLIDPIFAQLKQVLPSLIQTIAEKQKSEKLIPFKNKFPIDKQRQLGLTLMKAIGFDFDHGRLDVSHHPFCGGNPRDVRITTRYNENEFISSVMGVCHETGHAMYELGLPEQHIDQPVGRALGMAVHESQSLLTEMQACRSKEFIHFLATTTSEEFGADPAFSPENLLLHYTRVKPGFIRVDADEVTYPLHVIMRYEIEKQLFTGSLQAKDLPDIWHDYMQKFLGLSTVNNFKDGVMQDVHWPAGLFGYFPAYTLGALLAAQLFATAKQKNPLMLAQLQAGNFTTLTTWLRQNIHQKASLLSFNELVQQATGEPLSPRFYLDHVQKRYL